MGLAEAAAPFLVLGSLPHGSSECDTPSYHQLHISAPTGGRPSPPHHMIGPRSAPALPRVDGRYPSFGAGALDDMHQYNEDERLAILRKAYPGATDEQLRENAAVLRRYLEFMWRMYRREKGLDGDRSDDADTPID